ncbi:MAG: RluA family pseudouridine synthase [Saccharofermentans sp.]|jgi:23S rRNA pseudouridine1911/1915/1917 synthase|nr:RluA family pseudouridine synthase [Saccharofermentans sp.]MDY6339207.1 RluA family pseudouridine synthase [Saccharofermentans sp.]
MPVESKTCETDGLRLDSFVTEAFDSSYSRSFYKRLIDDGKVTVNGKVITKAGTKLSAGDLVEADIPAPVEDESFVAQDIPLDIVYEDSDLLVINKPQGMVVHPAAGHSDGTLVNALLAHCKDELSDINGVLRPGIVHRIDKDTSGLMLACKNNFTHLKLADMLSRHEIVREYRALVYGFVKEDKGMIDAPIGRSSNDRRKMAVNKDGKSAVTHFEVVERLGDITDLKLILETGRTHQIRVHMAYIGHPVVGDPVYAARRKNYGLAGQALHSRAITFVHPRTGETMHFEVDIPDYYKAVLDSFKGNC